MNMDTIDRKILTILQQNARTPLKVIAEQVFLSSPAVSARIERLESAGYIQGYQAQLSCAALGYQIKAFISLEVEPSQKPEFYPYIEGCPNVMECNCVTGDYSMFIKVCFHTSRSWINSSTNCIGSAERARRSSFPPRWSIAAFPRWIRRKTSNAMDCPLPWPMTQKPELSQRRL